MAFVFAAWNGKRCGDTVWPGLWRTQVRYARNISPAIDDPPHVDWGPCYVHLHFLQAPLALAR
jgi:hypothetical protein